MKSYGKSHIGLRRKNNQDSICLAENKGALIAFVCDGIGGGKAGDIASQLAVSSMKEQFLNSNIENMCEEEVKNWIFTAIQKANDDVHEKAQTNEVYKGMGTTIVGILHCQNVTYVFNVGDSRAYAIYKDEFSCLTQDHSYVADLVKRGELTAEEARSHPNRNVLTNALGIWETLKIDVNKIKEEYQSILICSDGLHGYVDEKFIHHILESNSSVEKKVDLLIQSALDAGGFDNVSVIVLEKENCDNE